MSDSSSFVVVVPSADFRDLKNLFDHMGLHLAVLGAVHVQGEMTTPVVVAVEAAAQDASQVVIAQHDDRKRTAAFRPHAGGRRGATHPP